MKRTTRIWGGILGALLATANAVEAPAAGWPASTGGKRGGLVELFSGPSQQYAENDAYRKAQQSATAPQSLPPHASRPDIIPAAAPRGAVVAGQRPRGRNSNQVPPRVDVGSQRYAARESAVGRAGVSSPFSPLVFGDSASDGVADPMQTRRAGEPSHAAVDPVNFQGELRLEEAFVAQSPNDLDELVPPQVNDGDVIEQLPAGSAPPVAPSRSVAPTDPRFVPSPQDPSYNPYGMGRQTNTLTALLGDERDEYQRQMCEQQFCQQMWQCAGGRCLSWRDRVLRDWRRTYETVYRGPSECQQFSLISMVCEPILYPRQNIGWVVGMGPIAGGCHVDRCTSEDAYWNGFCDEPTGCTTGACATPLRRPLLRRPQFMPRAVESSCTTESCTAPTPGGFRQTDLFHAPGLHGTTAGCASGNCGCATGACGS